MEYKTKVARTYIFMFEACKESYHIKEALKADYEYTIMMAIEKGFYWKIDRNIIYPKLKAV